MKKSWSDLNKLMQTQLKNQETFSEGINTLLSLRSEMFKIIESFFSDLSLEEFSVLPFPKSRETTMPLLRGQFITFSELKILFAIL